MYAFVLVDAGAGCMLRVYGFLAFPAISLFALNYCPWLSHYFWHIFGPACVCTQADVNCSLKSFVTVRTCASCILGKCPRKNDCKVMNIAQNVCFFAKYIFQLLQDTLYQLILIHFVTFCCEKKNHDIKLLYVFANNISADQPAYPRSLIGAFLLCSLMEFSSEENLVETLNKSCGLSYFLYHIMLR